MNRSPTKLAGGVRTGTDAILDSGDWIEQLAGSRVAVLAHGASVTRDFVHLVDALLERNVRPVRLFGPEHGLRGEAQDMIPVTSEVDAMTGLPCVSLYGHDEDSLTPRPEQLEDIDVLLIDLQDVGSRYYTYMYTAMLAAQAATAAGARTVVLDRPNPIGTAREGGSVHPGFESFVGMLPLPNRHGLTLAQVLEYARLAGRTIDFEAIPVQGASGGESAVDPFLSGAPWVMPSPNMPTRDTALVYPGLCLLEGTNLSEGRGTTRPFELFGAPWMDAVQVGRSLHEMELPGVRFRVAGFEPGFQKWAGHRCRGLQLHVTDPEVFRPVLTGLAIVWTCRRLHPDDFAWRSEAYEFVADRPAIDLLFGQDQTRGLIDDEADFDVVRDSLLSPVPNARLEEASRFLYGIAS
ncbi:MAG: DUF1343 domain-containing protein [Deltaproteobacteria bacterium]|nr:MAG: DUF1343 domain-containing protein [Deltaproteobacteria bacterium]